MVVRSAPSVNALSADDEPRGRVAILSAFAAAATAIPLPFLPERVVASIRGALAQDIVARHGLSMTSEARQILAEPHYEERAAIRRAAELITRQLLKRLRTFTIVATVVRGFEVYSLGLLLDRYIRTVRPRGAVRIHGDEARDIRKMLDSSLFQALSPSLSSELTALPSGPEDLRDEFTRWLDAIILTSASVPHHIQRRLEAAFDAVAATKSS